MSYCSRISRALRATLRLSALLLLAGFVLLGARAINAQSMPGFQAPEKPLAPEELVPDSIKAARGLAPLSRLYGHLIMDASKARRLPPLDPKEQKKAVSDKLLRIGVVRPLPLPLNPLTDSTSYIVAEGEVNVGPSSRKARSTLVCISKTCRCRRARAYSFIRRASRTTIRARTKGAAHPLMERSGHRL